MGSHCMTISRSRQGQALNDRGPQFTFAACLASGAWHDVSIPEALEKEKAATGKRETEQIYEMQRCLLCILALEMLKSHEEDRRELTETYCEQSRV